MYKIVACLDVYIKKVYFQKPAAPWEIENGLSEMYTKSILLAEYSANICVYCFDEEYFLYTVNTRL